MPAAKESASFGDFKGICANSLSSCLKELDADPKKGLKSAEALQRIKVYGLNRARKGGRTSGLSIFFRQFHSYITYILIFAAALSYAVGDFKEFYVITAIIVFNVLLGFGMEFKATREMAALKNLTPKMSRVMRDGKAALIRSEEIVPGDIIILERGDIIGADCRIASCTGLKVNESALTGESESVEKDERDLQGSLTLAEQKNMVFAGTSVVDGRAVCVAVATDDHTEIGKISRMMEDIDYSKSPLQLRMDKLGRQFSMIVIVICIAVFMIGLYRGQHWEEMLLLAIAVAVSGIPESLPTVIAVALAIGVKRMARQNTIMKKMSAVETLGSCNVICTDKTGTLTQNKMVIEKIFTFDGEVHVTGEGFTPKGLFMREKEVIRPHHHGSLLKILEVGALCNNASLLKKDKEWHIEGETTEGAFVVLARKAGLYKKRLHAKHPRLHEHPFDSERKIMSVVHNVSEQPIAYSKGAPEMILNKSRYFLEGGKTKKLTDAVRENVLSIMQGYGAQGLRVLGLAYKELKGDPKKIQHVESGLVFLGLAAMRDPPEPSTYEAVRLCSRAGTRVVMITGDNKDTASAIAKDLGILREQDRVLSGAELDSMDDVAFSNIADCVAVYARSTPAHKLRIVRVLQERGAVVAMTGDGVNDAPALKKADIGIAMGKRGTDVAKEAAEMVIKDDNFATIVNAIREGRTIFSNIRRFLYYLLAGNFSEVLIILIASFFGILPPLTPLMILFVNVVTSELPAFGLAMEKPHESIMHQKPRDKNEGILNEYLFLRIGQLLPLIVLGTLSLFLWEVHIKGGSVGKAQTVAFAAIIFFEMFHVFNAKSFTSSIFSRRIFDNPSILAGVVLSVGLTLLVIYWAPAQAIFGTEPLLFAEWVAIIVMASSLLLYVELQKSVIRTEIRERDKLKIGGTLA